MKATQDLPDVAGLVEAVAIRSLVDTLSDPLVLLAPVRDDHGRVVDFAYLEANAAACAFEGLEYERAIGSRMLEIHPGNLEAGTFDNYIRVLETGEPLAGEAWCTSWREPVTPGSSTCARPGPTGWSA